MRYIWCIYMIYEIYMIYIWDIYEIYMIYIYMIYIYDIYIYDIWDIYEIYVYIWDIYDIQYVVHACVKCMFCIIKWIFNSLHDGKVHFLFTYVHLFYVSCGSQGTYCSGFGGCRQEATAVETECITDVKRAVPCRIPEVRICWSKSCWRQVIQSLRHLRHFEPNRGAISIRFSEETLNISFSVLNFEASKILKGSSVRATIYDFSGINSKNMFTKDAKRPNFMSSRSWEQNLILLGHGGHWHQSQLNWRVLNRLPITTPRAYSRCSLTSNSLQIK